jgi:hypothetical protein
MKTLYALSIFAIACTASSLPSAIDVSDKLIKNNTLASSKVKEIFDNAAEVRAAVVARESSLLDERLLMEHLVLNKK